jgi:hypothetical protein
MHTKLMQNNAKKIRRNVCFRVLAGNWRIEHLSHWILKA